LAPRAKKVSVGKIAVSPCLRASQADAIAAVGRDSDKVVGQGKIREGATVVAADETTSAAQFDGV
jgi:hypothetical protein